MPPRGETPAAPASTGPADDSHVNWTTLVEAVPSFDGSSPALLPAWLKAVEATFEPFPQYAGLRVAAARKKLSGLAASALVTYMGNDWAELKRRLERRFDAKAARADIQRQLTEGSRYQAMSFGVALDSATADYEVLGSGLSFSVLNCLAARVPATVLDSIQFSPADEFKETVDKLRLAWAKAQARADKHSSWASADDSRVYASHSTQPASPSGPFGIPAIPSQNASPRSGVPSRSAKRRARERSRIAKLEDQVQALASQLTVSSPSSPASSAQTEPAAQKGFQ